jgi:hypothetical protein
MRLATVALIGALGLTAVAVSARAAPLAPDLATPRSANIVQVWGGCGWGFHPVPAHWSQWRGGWVPPHCAPNGYGGGYGGGYYRGGYAGGYPYGGWHRHYW